MIYNITSISLYALYNGYTVPYYIFCAIVNVVFSTLTHREIQARSPSTLQSYDAWLNSKRKLRLPRKIQELEETGGRILWVGNPSKATKVVLFFHGGGFVAAALKGHFEWCWNAYIQGGREAGVEVAVAVLQYSLLTDGQFPVALQQAAASLGEVLDAGFAPSDIIIGGDSAGGNITMQLMSHLLHPLDGVRRFQLSEPLRAIFLVSPFLSNNLTWPSFHENDSHDMISIKAINTLAVPLYGEERIAEHRAAVEAGDYSGANPHETPLDAGENFLDGLDRLVPKIYLTVGKNEVMRDQGLALIDQLKKRGTKSEIKVEIGDREAHDFILVENIFRRPGDATQRMKNWFKSVVV